MDNYDRVIAQMEAFGVTFLQKDFPLSIDAPKRKGCGEKGKFWYWLRSYRPSQGGELIVGRFGSYKTGESEKVYIDWKGLSDTDRLRMSAEREAARVRAEQVRLQDAELAAMSAAELWAKASRSGESAYLVRKGVLPEACKFMRGELLVPLLRYDMPKEHALRGLQRIKPDGFKRYTKNFSKTGCAVRLGQVMPNDIVLVCEGYATGLTIRMAINRSVPVFVALDAGNLQSVVLVLRKLYPEQRILICADDDYLTTDAKGQLDNVGRRKAREIAKKVSFTDLVYPIFDKRRGPKDTDFNDLHALQGLDAVTRQISTVLGEIRKKHG